MDTKSSVYNDVEFICTIKGQKLMECLHWRKEDQTPKSTFTTFKFTP